MKNRVIFLASALIGIPLLIGSIWAWKHLRGAGPAFRPPPDDIIEIANTTGLPLRLPAGASIEVFAKDLPGARVMKFDQWGHLWVSLTRAGKVIRIVTMEGSVDRVDTVLSGLNNPHGLAFDPKNSGMLYVAEENKVSKVCITCLEDYMPNYRVDITDMLEKVADIPNDGGGHFTRTIEFAPDGRLLVSIGSSCNVCNEGDKRRAAILSMNPDGSDAKIYAKGLRNSVFFTWSPHDEKLYATEMGRDYLGDDLPPDEVNIIEEGKDYGWPICYGKGLHDTDFDKRQYLVDPCGTNQQKEGSLIDLPAHSAPLGLAFVPNKVWPKEYENNLLIAFHGSWNRSEPTGYKIMKLSLGENGQYNSQDFVSGWLVNGGALGRPVDLLFHDGSLFISDDKAGAIYRLWFPNA